MHLYVKRVYKIAPRTFLSFSSTYLCGGLCGFSIVEIVWFFYTSKCTD